MATKVGPVALPAFFNSNADFEAWVTGIHNALSSLGFVQTADTGQINPATVAAPTTTNQSVGYEIWRFNDTHQSDAPLYFKIEYGSNGQALTGPGLWLTVGSGSNGAGTLTGQLSSRQQAGASAVKTAGVTLPLYACSDGSDLSLLVNYDSANNQFYEFFHIARLRDQNGSATADGAWFFNANPGGNGSQQLLPVSGSVPAAVSNSFPAVRTDFFARSVVGANADICPVLLPVGGNWRYGRLAIVNPTDFGSGGTFTTTLFGATHTFFVIGNAGNAYGMPVGNGSGNAGLAFAWE